MMRALLAYDGSAGAEEAASLVLGLSWPPGSVVRVVAVVEPSVTVAPALPLRPAGFVDAPEIEAQIIEHLRTGVDHVRRRLDESGIATEGDVLGGRPGTVLIDEAQRFAADLIVAGSRGHGAIAALVLGSVSAELVDQAPAPVLVARGRTAGRVLFASDGSPSASHAEETLAQWPIFRDAAIRVVSVADVIRPLHTGLAPTLHRQVVEDYAKDLDAAKTEHEATARGAAERLSAAGRPADAALRVGDAATEIVEEASSWQADLVVLGSRGRTGLTRIVLGSVARNVLHGTRSSVLVVRPPS